MKRFIDIILDQLNNTTEPFASLQEGDELDGLAYKPADIPDEAQGVQMPVTKEVEADSGPDPLHQLKHSQILDKLTHMKSQMESLMKRAKEHLEAKEWHNANMTLENLISLEDEACALEQEITSLQMKAGEEGKK